MNAFYKEEEFNNEFYLMPDPPPHDPDKPGTGNDGDSEEEKS
ncbi:MAG: hypothetical protein ACPGRE_02430 [Flavobacteriaceae bacterium]